MRVIDRWTTQHGSWEIKPENKYGIDQAHRDKYLSGRDIPPAGADHHILVKVKPGQGVQFYSGKGAPFQVIAPASGWVDFPMSKDAGYEPAKGEKGPWQVAVNMEVVADGIGMPDYEHVSTFLVVDEGEPVTDSQPTQPLPLTAQQALAQVRHDLDVLESLLGGN